MATLTAWKFPTPHGADAAEYTLRELERAGAIVVHDAAVVSWDQGARKPSTRELEHPGRKGAMRGGLWGLLFGLVFFVPVLGVAVGATVGAMSKKLRKAGIDDDFVERVRREVVPGTSALFALTSDADVDRVRGAFAGQDMTLISTNLSAEQEQALRDVVVASGTDGDDVDSEGETGQDEERA